MISVYVLLSLILPIQADTTHAVKRSDDASFESLQALVQQQATMMQTLLARQEATTSRITALETENAVLKNRLADVQSTIAKLSKAVAFTVRFKADNEADGVALGTHSILKFDDIVLNTGNSYDPYTGVFTAPVAGTYVFFLTQMGAGSHSYPWLSMIKDGRYTLDVVYSKNNADQGSGQVTAYLDAGGRVWVQQLAGNAVRGAWYTLFSGYLLQAE